MASIQSTINDYKKKLKELYPAEEINSIALIAIEEVTRHSKSRILSNKDHELDIGDNKALKEILNRLIDSEPLQQILGFTEFFGYQLKINKHVLIPRPETEELVSLILQKTEKNKTQSILDIGTGSGCIPIALKKNLPNSSIKAIDIDAEAIKLAEDNASLHNLEISFKVLNFLEKVDCNKSCLFDIIVSNPPYVMQKEKKLMHKNVLKYEPHKALFVPDNNPLLFYEAIQKYASKHLNKSGMIFLEINENLGTETLNLFSGNEYSNSELIKDLKGKDRFVIASKA